MRKGYAVRTRKPSNGGLEQLVTNLRSFRFCSSVNFSTADHKALMTGWSTSYPPVIRKKPCIVSGDISLDQFKITTHYNVFLYNVAGFSFRSSMKKSTCMYKMVS